MKKGIKIKKRQGAEKIHTLIITNVSDTSTKPSSDSGTGKGNSNQIPIRNK
jgi:hypothetical protein